jgi:uncharacterized protein (DUF2164 family)
MGRQVQLYLGAQDIEIIKRAVAEKLDAVFLAHRTVTRRGRLYYQKGYYDSKHVWVEKAPSYRTNTFGAVRLGGS